MEPVYVEKVPTIAETSVERPRHGTVEAALVEAGLEKRTSFTDL